MLSYSLSMSETQFLTVQNGTGWCQLSLLSGKEECINAGQSVSTTSRLQGFSKTLLEVVSHAPLPRIFQDTHQVGMPANPLPPQGLPIHEQAASLNESGQ